MKIFPVVKQKLQFTWQKVFLKRLTIFSKRFDNGVRDNNDYL